MRKSQNIRTYAFLLHDLPMKFSLILPFLTRFRKKRRVAALQLDLRRNATRCNIIIAKTGKNVKWWIRMTGVSLLAFEVYASYIKSVARSFYSQLLLLWIPMRTKFPLCFLSAFFLILFLFPFIQILSTFLV